MNRNQLELELPRRRAVLTEPAVAPARRRLVVDDMVEVRYQDGTLWILKTTGWFPDRLEPRCSGYWEVKDLKSGFIQRVYYSRQVGWPDDVFSKAFHWRGLAHKPPGPVDYSYPVPEPKTSIRLRLIEQPPSEPAGRRRNRLDTGQG